MVGVEYSIYKWGDPGEYGDRIERFTKLEIQLRWGEPAIWSLESQGLDRVPFQIGEGITIYRGETRFMDGVVETIEESRDEMAGGVVIWRAAGRDLTTWLTRRLVLPDPIGLRFDESLQDVYTGAPEMAIRTFCNRNIGKEAAPNRRVAGLCVESSTGGLGSDMYAFRLESLADAVKEIGGKDLSVSISRDWRTGEFILATVRRREMTGEVVFSAETGTVLSWTRKAALPKANVIWIAGGGEGTDRIVVTASSDESIAAYGRIEGWVSESVSVQEATQDKPAITSADVISILERKADEALKENAASESYTVEIREGVRARFIDDWQVGDRVSCMIDGTRIISTIDSAAINYDSSGENVAATIGEVDHGIFSDLFQRIVEIQKGLESEERV